MPVVGNLKAQSEIVQSHQPIPRHRDAFDTDAEDLDDTTVFSTKSMATNRDCQQQEFTLSTEHDGDLKPPGSCSYPAHQGFDLNNVDDITQSDDIHGSYHTGDVDGFDGTNTERLPNKIVATGHGALTSGKPSLVQQEEIGAHHSTDQPQPFSRSIARHNTNRRSIESHHWIPQHPGKQHYPVTSSASNHLEKNDKRDHHRRHDHERVRDDQSSELITFSTSGQGLLGLRYPAKPQNTPNHRKLNGQLGRLNISTDVEQSIDEGVHKPMLTNVQYVSMKKPERNLDYNDVQLAQMTYQQLRNESFDYDPTAMDQKEVPTSVGSSSLQNKLHHIFSRHHDESQAKNQEIFFTSLPIDQHELCGDIIIDEFRTVMSKFKLLRQQKRMAAYSFELEIERRQTLVGNNEKMVEEDLKYMQQKGNDIVPTKSNCVA